MRVDDLEPELSLEILEQAPLAIFVTDAQGRFVAVNRAAEQQTGRTREQLLGSRFVELLQPQSAKWAEEAFRRSAPGTLSDAEYQARRGDGQPYWTRVRGIALADGHHVAFNEDVTARRAQDEELHRLQTAIAHASEAIVITDTSARIQYVNPAFERVTGYSAAEVLGENPRMLSARTESPEFYQALWADLTAKRVWQGRFTNLKKNGTAYVEDASIAPVLGPDGEVVSYVAVKRDVTETLRLEKELRQSQKMDALGRLAGGVAHDFNNLLTIILSSTQLALEDLPKEAEGLRADLEFAVSAARRAEALTQQLLAFSRRQDARPEVVSLDGVIVRIADMIRRLIGETIELDTRAAPGLWLCEVDVNLIEQAVINLAVNARDAMPHGGRLSFETSNATRSEDSEAVGPVGELVRLRIRDDGCGMDEQTRLHAFDPFFTTKGEGKGTGLGLSTVHGAVKQCGGHIELRSEPGQGCCFDLYFPRAKRKSRRLPFSTGVRRCRTGAGIILVVEDDPGVLAVAMRVLTRMGHRVVPANGGEEALRIAKAEPVLDLLLTDVVMPGRSGVEIAREIKALHPLVAVLFMSGYPDDDIDRFRASYESSALLPKPFSPETLAAAVAAAVGGDSDHPVRASSKLDAK